jgi:hypothetical protein
MSELYAIGPLNLPVEQFSRDGDGSCGCSVAVPKTQSADGIDTSVVRHTEVSAAEDSKEAVALQVCQSRRTNDRWHCLPLPNAHWRNLNADMVSIDAQTLDCVSQRRILI